MPGITAVQLIDIERAKHAANLYNNIHDILTEYGWKEDMDKDPFWPDGKPTWSWRHPQYPHSHSMDAAFITCVQKQYPKRP